jgi:hypothetical protein
LVNFNLTIGFETIISVLGQIVIHVAFLVASVAILFNQSFFVCKEFDSKYVDLRRWWEMSDNYEGAMLGILTTFQIFHSSCAFAIGEKYRRGFFQNKTYIAVYLLFFGILSFLLLADPNQLGCLFHINCGTRSALESARYKVNFMAPAEYYSSIGHNVFPLYFRIVILIMSVLNLMCILFWEKVVVLGPVRLWTKKWADGKWQVKKKEVKV